MSRWKSGVAKRVFYFKKERKILSSSLPNPNHPMGFTQDFLEKEFERFGQDAWKNFQDWMKGQTIGIGESDQIIYYEYDVYRYLDRGGLNAKIYD